MSEVSRYNKMINRTIKSKVVNNPIEHDIGFTHSCRICGGSGYGPNTVGSLDDGQTAYLGKGITGEAIYKGKGKNTRDMTSYGQSNFDTVPKKDFGKIKSADNHAYDNLIIPEEPNIIEGSGRKKKIKGGNKAIVGGSKNKVGFDGSGFWDTVGDIAHTAASVAPLLALGKKGGKKFVENNQMKGVEVSGSGRKKSKWQELVSKYSKSQGGVKNAILYIKSNNLYKK